MGINDDPWALALVDDRTMGGFAPVWDYHENIDDLKHKLLYTTLELESLRANSKEELRRKEEEMKRKYEEIMRKEEEMRRKEVEIMRKEEEKNQLTQLLKITTQERDEARDEVQMLLNKIVQLPNAVDLYPIAPVSLQVESPLQMRLTRGGSSITESDSPSETHNHHHSFVSSPVEFDTVTSPNLSNINMSDTFNIGGVPYPPLFDESKNSNSIGMGMAPSGITKHDKDSWIIDCLAMQKALPEKGKLLQAVQAVTRATPLLETLLMTGSLPEWRNPPPSLPFHIAPATVKGCGTQVLSTTALVNPSHLPQSSLNGLHHEKSQGASHVSMESPSMCEVRKAITEPRVCSYKSSAAKWQKIQ